MPSRIAQTFCTAIFILVLYFTDKTRIESLWFLIPSGILAVAAFTLGSLINSIWYSKFPPALNTYEFNWTQRYVPFIQTYSVEQKKEFALKLAAELKEKEFISMSEKDMPEEIKIMCMAPAIRLNLSSQDKAVSHYRRLILYHHAFATPDQPYLHLSETQHEDGAIILASDALEAAYLRPQHFFNIALYEWCCIWIHLGKHLPLVFPSEELSWPLLEKLLSTDQNTLSVYLKQPKLNTAALICYGYIMHPESFKIIFPHMDLKRLER
jgi:hypothetical protein